MSFMNIIFNKIIISMSFRAGTAKNIVSIELADLSGSCKKVKMTNSYVYSTASVPYASKFQWQ